MKESMKCAKTLAWNLIPVSHKKKINEEWENIGTYGTHSSLNNPRSYFAFFFKTFGGMFLVVLFTLIVSVFAYMYYSEKQAIVLNNDLRKIRKKWSARGKSD